MTPELELLRIRYLAFAEHQAHGVSPRYETLATAIAESEPLLRFIESLPSPKQQPNLFLAAARWVCGLAEDGSELAEHVRGHGEQIRVTALSRSTQTNEAGRCATLLPVLASLPQPLALLEVGASAGLCLIPDRYGYEYSSVVIPPPSSSADAPTLVCATTSGEGIPREHPEVIWRRGLDLNPIDVGDPDQTAWLENLVWPEQETRRSRLRHALRVAACDPPLVERGDLLEDLVGIATTAPSEATLVVFHSAVLNYVGEADRVRFRRILEDLGATWVSNEGLSVFPDITSEAGSRCRPDRFLLSLDGVPVAMTGFHGQTFEWL